MERHYFEESGPKLLSGKGIRMMQPYGIYGPTLCNSPNGQSSAPRTAAVAVRRGLHRLRCRGETARALQLGGFGHDRPSPGSVEEAGLAGLISRDFL